MVGLTVSECVCPPDSKIKYSVFYVYSCSCIIILLFYLYLLCSRKANFYVIRTIIGNKDYVSVSVIYEHKYT